MTDLVYHRLLAAYLLSVLTALLVFAYHPGLDLAVSRLLIDAAQHVAIAPRVLKHLNDGLRLGMELFAFAALVATLLAWRRPGLKGAALRCWGFIALNLLLAPGLVVNLILKSNLGRARPVDVIEFGGGAHFTPAWVISDQCVRNCSFTSGDVGLVASVSICVVVLLWQRLSKLGRGWAVVAACLSVVVISMLRLALGRHFLSDVIFSTLISGGVALVLYPVLLLGDRRPGVEGTKWSLARMRPAT
ncbi:phosphatase PAP2 family protein [Paracoccus sp. MBLB3053]|uniref:Phosphatase PAP2 family protein n=1 Tax=Paracoccus aurantius TaxID=3073814 RepID=A0ABU2HRL2_9RHOB|nr:phosphatase PAP2 family protein [Paracoccus sp. MBLB3053]MDS9467695.1 phosphatase PAP2 family protein [Paracoccus sp. MBLB3053]